MGTQAHTFATFTGHFLYPATLIGVLVESSLILAVALVWCLLSRRASAASRHLVWFLAVASLPLLLVLSGLSENWMRPIWSITSGPAPGNTVPLSISLAPSLNGAGSGLAAARGRAGRNQENRGLLAPSASRTNGIRIGWPVAFFYVWAAGTLLLLVSMLGSRLQVARLLSRATPVKTPEWELLLTQTCQALSLSRRPRLFRADHDAMPMTWGSWRPILLVPLAADGWPRERRRVVLLHELAHIKRWDSLTQSVARVIGSFFWINPLVWLAAARMRVERERACDDLVLLGGWKPSDYAAQLLDIAHGYQGTSCACGIAMARASQLHKRIAAIVSTSHARSAHPLAIATTIGSFSLLAVGLAGTGGHTPPASTGGQALQRQQLDQLESFARAKEKQSEALAQAAGESIAPDFREYFDAAIAGNVRVVTNQYAYLKLHHPQYTSGTNAVERLRTAYWSPILELCLAYDHFANCDPHYTQILAAGIIDSIPAGSIYFGGTDPGRGVPTAFEKSSINADPFFCLTQNALADGTYLDYLRAMYGARIYIPTEENSQRCYQEYVQDATRRMRENRLKPGEQVKEVNGKVSVAGQIPVMAINGLLSKVIFDENPDREFFIEESFPLEWMYPHLEPHGLILKINREVLPQIPEEAMVRDHTYWSRLVAGMLGDWLSQNTTIRDLADFVRRVYVRKDLAKFGGDPLFVGNDYAKRIFSKLRCSIGGLYAWRLGPEVPLEFKPATESQRQRLTDETDFAFRQAFALCPYSSEAVFRYVNFLVQRHRLQDAILVTETSLAVDSKSAELRDLLAKLHNMHSL